MCLRSRGAPPHIPAGGPVSPRVRAGIVGVRFMGEVHARAIRRAGGVVVAAVGATPESSRAAAERLGTERVAESVEGLVAVDDIDVVHIWSGYATHGPLVR